KWFLLQLVSSDADINMQTSSTPEFDGWRWVSYWYPVRQVVSFKRDVYRRVMKEFAGVVMALTEATPKPQVSPAWRRKRG
ncbi:MAG TPA: RNA pyrophosphohydrolase, partial [Leclercia adecarboxylata]|nr:RNA pyrophosphohydrolase [Leclercia adecarboxylata]